MARYSENKLVPRVTIIYIALNKYNIALNIYNRVSCLVFLAFIKCFCLNCHHNRIPMQISRIGLTFFLFFVLKDKNVIFFLT